MSTPLTIDVFWSMRSPYCYLALDRLLELRRLWSVEIALRVVYPIAVRNPDFFKTAPRHYRSYHLLDAQRVADFNAIPYGRPQPDPILQDMETNEIAAEQPHIRHLTRLAAAAGEEGKGLDFQDRVMRLLWDGSTDNWNKGSHLRDAIAGAGLDADALLSAVESNPEHFDAVIETNQQAQADAGHGGVPLFSFNGEPFFGQDRLEPLLWRLKQHGLQQR